MTDRLASLAAAAVAAACLAACATAPSRFYTLDATATADAPAPAARYTVMVGPVYMEPPVDRPEFVTQVSANQVEVNEFNRWAAPLGDSIARVVATNLGVLLGISDVAVGPLANFRPTYRVSINVQRFESVPGRSVLIDAVWLVQPSGPREAISGRTVSTETVSGGGTDTFDALAAAHSRALVAVSADIAAAIRAEAAAPAGKAAATHKK